jgi:hypothetical protein
MSKRSKISSSTQPSKNSYSNTPKPIQSMRSLNMKRRIGQKCIQNSIKPVKIKKSEATKPNLKIRKQLIEARKFSQINLKIIK